MEQSISEGIVSGNREQDDVSWIQHSAPISPGSSGGALISSRRELLGINSRYRKESQNLNFAVPAATLRTALSEARRMPGVLDFPPNSDTSGTYSGVVQNLTAATSADFTISINEKKDGAIQGCMAVKMPLIGSGGLQGANQGQQLSFVVAGDFTQIHFDGRRDGANLSSTYFVSNPDGRIEKGTFTLHKVSLESPSAGFNILNCPHDAAFIREAAEKGDAQAQLRLGILYSEDLGVPRDDITAAAWYRKAAEQGNAEAQATLGAVYELGRGEPQDFRQAAAWYGKAATKGNPDAEYALGVLYREGHGVPKDYAIAATWYRKAAEQGFAAAQVTLGVAYMVGRGVPQNYRESYFWLSLAANGKPYLKPEDLRTAIDRVVVHLTAADLAEEQDRVRKWQAAHPSTAK